MKADHEELLSEIEELIQRAKDGKATDQEKLFLQRALSIMLNRSDNGEASTPKIRQKARDIKSGRSLT